MAVLNWWSFYTMDSQGVQKSGKQGSAEDAAQIAYPVTVDGLCHQTTGQIADDAIATIWDEDDDSPADFTVCHIWTDQDCFLQVITTATNFIIPILAKVPFCLSGNTALAAANTTPMVAAVTPSTTAIDSVILSNLSGETLNYVASFID